MKRETSLSLLFIMIGLFILWFTQFTQQNSIFVFPLILFLLGFAVAFSTILGIEYYNFLQTTHKPHYPHKEKE